MIVLRTKGDFKAMHKALEAMSKEPYGHYKRLLNKYGQMGVEALRNATPVDTGLTADSWDFEIRTSEKYGYYAVIWKNTNVVNDWANVAILLQYGHATRNGGYVQGRDFINPTIQPIFDKMADEMWKEIELGHATDD